MEVRDFASSVDEIKANQQEDEARAPSDNKNSLKDGFYLHRWEIRSRLDVTTNEAKNSVN